MREKEREREWSQTCTHTAAVVLPHRRKLENATKTKVECNSGISGDI